MITKERLIRIVFSVAGVALAGISVSFLKLAAFGVDPFQAFAAGLHALIPIDFGTLYLFIGLALLIFSLILDRHYIGLATVITFLLQGYVIDFFRELLFGLFPEADMGVRIVSMAIGIVLLCFSTAIYFTADLGVSAYDAIALILANTLKWGQFRYNRILMDCICVVIGGVAILYCGATVAQLFEVIGVGTIITAFCMGPLVDLFRRRVVTPVYQRLIAEK